MRRDPRKDKGQVERLARSYHRRFEATLGASHSVEDLAQEFWIVWQRVCEKFDPDRGQNFEALLGVSIRNRAIEMSKFFGRRVGISTLSLNAAAVPDGEDDFVDYIEYVASEDETPEEALLRKERTSELLARIDPRMRKIIDMLESPSPLLEAEIEALNAKADRGQAMGVSNLPPRRLTLTTLTKVFGLSRCSGYRLLNEMKEVMEND